jgi:hypothetical protein
MESTAAAITINDKTAVGLHMCADCAYWKPALTYYGEPTGQGGCRFSVARNRKGDLLRECNRYEEARQMSADIVFKTEDSIWQSLA